MRRNNPREPTIAKSPPTTQGTRRLDAALTRLGCEVLRWRGQLATVRRRGERFHVSADTIATMLNRPLDSAEDDELALLLSDLLAIPPDPSLLDRIDLARPMLRPRLVHSRELDGPKRLMCRREAWGEMLATISIGPSSHSPLITTRQLDAWGIEFEDAMLIANDNLRRLIDTSDLHDVDGAPGLLAVRHESEPAASAVFILKDLLPGIENSPGVVFSTPAEDTLLLLPVERDAGAKGLAGLVQATYALAAERDEPLSEQLFWRIRNEVLFVPMTWIEEGGSRVVRLDATEGVLADLLGYMGEVE